jgi:hypothetical protein
MSAPSSAAVIGSLPQSTRPLRGADVSTHYDGGTSQLGSCSLNRPGGVRRMVGRLIALADTLIWHEVQALQDAEEKGDWYEL